MMRRVAEAAVRPPAVVRPRTVMLWVAGVIVASGQIAVLAAQSPVVNAVVERRTASADLSRDIQAMFWLGQSRDPAPSISSHRFC